MLVVVASSFRLRRLSQLHRSTEQTDFRFQEKFDTHLFQEGSGYPRN